MARKVTITQAEEQALAWAWDRAVQANLRDRGKTAKSLEGLLVKAQKSRAPQESTGLSLRDAEQALAGCSKYAPFAGGDAHALCRQLARLRVTPEQLRLVGEWVDSQPWLQSVDLGLVLGKWSGWLSRAAAMPRTTNGFIKPAGFVDE